ncbi:MAG: aminopeptidase P family N-terminal domain-containing protein, partial [Desulforhopalus sp.]
MEYRKRIDTLQAKLRRKKIDGLLVAKPENRRYLCGYQGGDHGIHESSGMLLVPAKGKVILLTDFRFKLQAEREVPWAELLLYPKGLLQLLTSLVPDLGFKTL